jgi:hypothetical protein
LSERVPGRQRVVFLVIAVLIAAVALVVLRSGSDDGDTETAATPTPAATQTAAGETATPTPTPTATAPPQPPLVTGVGVKKLRFKQGDTVRFRVRADVTDEVHVHGYDLKKDVTPGQTVTFSFPASITGIFEIEFENAGRQIAQLRVDPS